MPRSHKNKGRSHGKRTLQGVRSDQRYAEKEAALAQLGQGDPPSSPDTSNLQGPTSPNSSDAGMSCADANVGAEGFAVIPKGSSKASKGAGLAQPTFKDALNRKSTMLTEFLLEKFQTSEHFNEADMMRVVSKKFKVHFPDILRKTTARMEMVFGMELKEVNPRSHTFALVSKLGLSTDEILSCKRGLSKMGLLMAILGVIFTKGNHAAEGEVWEFLSVLGVYPGKKHLIFGEPRKLITKDLVEQNYLEIRQLPGSRRPRYDLLWGSQAYIETNKMKVLEVWAKINDTDISSFPNLYEEALRDQTDRAEKRAAPLGCTAAMARGHTKSTPRSSSHN